MEYALPSEMGLGSFGWKCIDIFACCNCDLYQQQRRRCLWALSMVLGSRTLGFVHFTVHWSIRVCSPTKQLEWQPRNMTRQRAVGSDMSGVWWGWGPFTSAACRFESVAPPNTKRYFYADCCGVNNSTVLSLRLHFVFQAQRRRPYIPRFSFKTNRGEPQVGLFTGEAGAESCVVLLCGEADTSTCGSQDLVRSQ